MPRASYGDRHCISVVHNGQQTAFDFTSRVIDFTVLSEGDPAAGRRAEGVVWCGVVWGRPASGRHRQAVLSVNKEGGLHRGSQTGHPLGATEAAATVPLPLSLPAWWLHLADHTSCPLHALFALPWLQ